MLKVFHHAVVCGMRIPQHSAELSEFFVNNFRNARNCFVIDFKTFANHTETEAKLELLSPIREIQDATEISNLAGTLPLLCQSLAKALAKPCQGFEATLPNFFLGIVACGSVWARRPLHAGRPFFMVQTVPLTTIHN